MKNRAIHCFVLGALSLLVLANCERREPSPASSAPTGRGSEALRPPDSCAPQRALERLDTRAAVPLLPQMANHQKQNMRDHLLAVQEIVTGLASDDFRAIEQAAGRLGYSPQMAQMCTHMGAGAPGFSERALSFHRVADGIASAAHERDRRAVLEALSATLHSCTDCHAAFQQRVVEQLAFSPPPERK